MLSFNKGILIIDTTSMEVKKEKRLFPLQQLNSGYCSAFAERPGAVLNRLQLMNMVQGYDFEGYDRVIDAHIKNIRHKIEDNIQKPVFIKTVYVGGYKFIERRIDENQNLSCLHSHNPCGLCFQTSSLNG